MTNTRWLVFIGICLAIIGGLIFATKRNKVDVSKVDPSVISTSGNNADHVFGNKNSKVILVEYGDYQCPSCQEVAIPLKSLAEEYKDKIAYVFRNFPLTTIHPNALLAASSAEAAGLQDKFWEMHDLLYQQQTSWANSSIDQRKSLFDSYAKQLNLDVKKFNNDLAGERVSGKINYDRSLANKLGLQGTPTLFLNGKKLDDAIIGQLVKGDASGLKSQIDSAIKNQK
jgi:LPXTG-motif cell wall-anchored protein